MTHEPTTDLTLRRLDEAIAKLAAATEALEQRVATLESRHSTPQTPEADDDR